MMTNKDTLYIYDFYGDGSEHFLGFIHSNDGKYFSGWSRLLQAYETDGFKWEESVSGHLNKFKPIGQRCLLQW